ncbi:MAG: C/D box methylation guide ribonucleoprotein complex aNOP56 subunit [Candidatus Altiarchaeales archaeon]|nr:MAG: C/D box methylation guide ribonucleoprotein complex aNOP56 subunit [Candidatus Altiarchaeales archaeon]
MIKLTTNVLGTFALKNGKIIKRIPFPSDPEEVAERLLQIEGGVCREEIQMIDELRETGIKEIHVQNPGRFLGKNLEMDFIEDKESINPLDIAREIGVSKKEISELIFLSNLELTKKKLRVLERDQILIQAVCSLDDIEEVSNRLIGRLREWYSLYFPELDTLVKKHELYAEIIALGDKAPIDPGIAKNIRDAKKKSMGMEFSRSDLNEVKKLSDLILKLNSFRRDTEEYIQELMQDISPNISALAGPILGARLISIAGSLERLSRFPASTIQILGAEESFFRFLRTKKKPPKHGIIFQLPEIRSSPKNLRGKISRIFASKLAIAAKADHFKGEFIGDKLREEFLKRVEDLKKSNNNL